MRRSSQTVQGRIDVVATRPSQRRHCAVADFTCYRAHTFQVPVRSDGEARLYDVHTKRFKLPGHPDFFRNGHGKSWGLFPIPQRGIEDAYDVHNFATLLQWAFDPTG